MDINNKIPPNSIDSEKAVVGSLIIENDKLDEISNTISVEDFYHSENKIIYDAIKELLKHNKPADILTVKEQIIKTNNNSDNSELFAYLTEVVENTPIASNIQTYADHVRELSVHRQLIKAGGYIAESVYKRKDLQVKELLDRSEKKIFEIADQILRNKQDIVEIKDTIGEIVNEIHSLQEKSGIIGLETGFTDFDKLTSGLQNGDLIVIAGRPGMGKTSIAMNIAEHASIHNNIPVAIFSLEMPTHQIIKKMISSYGEINSEKLRKGNLNESDWENFNHAVQAFQNSTILLDETPAISPIEVRAKCRRIKRKYENLGLIVIDYLQLMTTNEKYENKVQEIAKISSSLKSLAKELNIPIIAISQLNRSVESREKKNKGRMPQMSDLRESGSIEQDADIIGFIYRDEYYNEDNKEEEGLADFRIAKHRNGATGKVKLKFEKHCTKFKNYIADSYYQNIDNESADQSYEKNKINLPNDNY